MGAICPVIYFQEDTATPRPSYRSVVTPDDFPAATVPVRPIDGIRDDWPSLMALAASLNGGAIIDLLPSLTPNAFFQCKSIIRTPDNAIFRGTPATKIVQSLTGQTSGSTLCAAFSGAGIWGTNLGLAADVPVGATTVSVNTTAAVGARLYLQTAGGQAGSTYAIKNRTGAGPFTLTLDRPVRFAFAAASSQANVLVTQPTNIQIYGYGMTITGTGAEYIGLSTALNCIVDGVSLDTSGGVVTDGGGIGAVYDTGTYNSVFSRMRVALPGALNGLFLAGCEATDIVSSMVSGMSAEGIVVNYCADVEIRARSTKNSKGMIVNVAPVNSGIRVFGSYCGNGTGIHLTGVSGAELSIEASYNGNDGLQMDTPGGASSDIAYGGTFVGNGAIGIHVATGVQSAVGSKVVSTGNLVNYQVDAGARGAVINGIDASGGTSHCLNISGEALVTGLTAVGANSGLIQVGGTLRLRNAYLESTGATMAIEQTAGTVDIDGMHVRHNAASGASYNLDGGVLSIANYTLDGPGSMTSGINAASGTTVRLGRNVNVDAAATPLAGAGMYSRGTVTANGASTVNVAFTDMRSTDRVRLVPTSGTPGGMPTVTRTVGVGFAIVSIAGDTRTFEWLVD